MYLPLILFFQKKFKHYNETQSMDSGLKLHVTLQFSNTTWINYFLRKVHFQWLLTEIFFKKFIVVQLQLSCLFPYCSPLPLPTPSPSTVNCLPNVGAHESSIHITLLSPSPSFPVILLALPLWSLSVCSLFPSLWFYFAHVFVLLIRFHS